MLLRICWSFRNSPHTCGTNFSDVVGVMDGIWAGSVDAVGWVGCIDLRGAQTLQCRARERARHCRFRDVCLVLVQADGIW